MGQHLEAIERDAALELAVGQVVEIVEPTLERARLVGVLIEQGIVQTRLDQAQVAVPPSSRAMAPASARPFWAAVSVKFWISWAVITPSLLVSMSGKSW